MNDNSTPVMNPNPKPKNPFRVTVKALALEQGLSVEDFLEECCNDSVVPACCTEGCEVEPDGRCEHGCPSPLIALGMI